MEEVVSEVQRLASFSPISPDTVDASRSGSADDLTAIRIRRDGICR